MWFLLVISIVLKNISACVSFTANMIMLNNSVFDPHLGAINGLGQSLASLARAIGPAIGGALWSLSTQITPFINFTAIFLGLCLCLSINYYLPDTVNYKKKKKSKKMNTTTTNNNIIAVIHPLV